MKKTLSYISLALAAAFALSCEKNGPVAFDDANAFVAFDSATAGIDEGVVDEDGNVLPNPTTLKIPVTLASVGGIKTSVPFTVKDGTAIKGTNYEVVTAGTLDFDAQNRTQYVEIKPLVEAGYTGDLNFTITLNATDAVSVGAAASCTVTIADLDHPLSDLIGDYTATSSTDANQNPWTMTLMKDATDVSIVWFYNIFANSGWAIAATMYYGNVNFDDEGKPESITLPFGQSCEYHYGTSPINLYWLAADKSFGKDGSMNIAIVKNANGKITGLDFDEDLGITAQVEDYVNPDDWDEGWIGFADPHITAVKK
ncbi:MAG: hypothetical protein IJ813_02805 [Bacteroidales bacterium]|nr:hypothetical protein [Bacteroidales bacterium]